MQTQLQTVLETLEVITSQGEASALLDGLAALQAGKSRPLSAIRAELRGKTKQAR
jgi:hypothetical protein